MTAISLIALAPEPLNAAPTAPPPIAIEPAATIAATFCDEVAEMETSPPAVSCEPWT